MFPDRTLILDAFVPLLSKITMFAGCRIINEDPSFSVSGQKC